MFHTHLLSLNTLKNRKFDSCILYIKDGRFLKTKKQEFFHKVAKRAPKRPKLSKTKR